LTADLDVRIADWKWGTFGFRLSNGFLAPGSFLLAPYLVRYPSRIGLEHPQRIKNSLNQKDFHLTPERVD
jgi:hypothetical protein